MLNGRRSPLSGETRESRKNNWLLLPTPMGRPIKSLCGSRLPAPYYPRLLTCPVLRLGNHAAVSPSSTSNLCQRIHHGIPAQKSHPRPCPWIVDFLSLVFPAIRSFCVGRQPHDMASCCVWISSLGNSGSVVAPRFCCSCKAFRRSKAVQDGYGL